MKSSQYSDIFLLFKTFLELNFWIRIVMNNKYSTINMGLTYIRKSNI